MTTEHDGPFDLAVLGLGAVGSWALSHAQALGMRCVGVDARPLLHALGSSHGGARVTRQAYFEHPDYVPLIAASTDMYRALARTGDDPVFEPCGTLVLGRPDATVIVRSMAAARSHGVPTEYLHPSDLAHRVPQFNLPGDVVGLMEPDAGFLRVETSLRQVQHVARQAGATLHSRTAVTHVDTTGDLIHLKCVDRPPILASAVVCAAGAWTARILPSLAPYLRVTRQVQGWLRQPASTPSLRAPTMPCWLIDRGDAPPLYGIPDDPLDPSRGAKIAVHGGDAWTDPDTVVRTIDGDDRAQLCRAAERWLTPARPRLHEANVCLYTSTVDGHFIVDRVAEDPRIVAVAGLSGHGFKMAPALGQCAVELAIGGQTSWPTSFLRRALRRPW